MSENDDSGRQILMAEDSPVQGVVLRRALTNNGFQVRWAKNGAEALKLVREDVPELIISDIEMPEMNGLEFCRTIKTDPNLKHIPFILCSSLSDPEDIITGLENGADGYVTKPYDEKYLMYRVSALLSNPIRMDHESHEPVEIYYAGRKHKIVADRLQILNLLLSTYENTVKQNHELVETQIQLRKINQRLDQSLGESDRLLRNILPEEVASELKKEGKVQPVTYDSVTVLFTDFMNFTQIAQSMSAEELVAELDKCFSYFDQVCQNYNLEKLKTIGDSYMCAGGIPSANATHPVDAVLGALEIQSFMRQLRELKQMTGAPYWRLRLGINTGPLVAGVIGEKKFAYDVWGDTVNVASRMETYGEIERVNISRETYELVKDFFDCEFRGAQEVKNKGTVEMYFVDRIKAELADDPEGRVGNARFHEMYAALAASHESAEPG
jgi:class 3 adenylate cyclase/DNA-binding NarL/FixJ family response regulator